MSYKKKALRVDEFGQVMEEYPDCEWIITRAFLSRPGPEDATRLQAFVSAFPFTMVPDYDEDENQIGEHREYLPAVSVVKLLDVEDLKTAYPQVYNTLHSALYLEGKKEGSYFEDAEDA